MNLLDASCYFDRTAATDPDSGSLLFKCQVDPFDDSRRDSASAYRRIMSVRPGTAMPAKAVVQLLGQVWVIGAMEPDGLENLHRQKYVIQHAPLLANVSRLSGFLLGAVASTVRAAAHWVKDAKQIEVSSETPQLFDVTVPSTADVRPHDIVWGAGYAYLALSLRPQASGLLVASCLELEQILPAAATLTTRTYDPLAGTYATSAPVNVNVNALLVRWQSLFVYASQASEKYRAGDVSVVLPGGTQATTNTLVNLAGVTYQTISTLDIAGAVVLHARKL